MFYRYDLYIDLAKDRPSLFVLEIQYIQSAPVAARNFKKLIFITYCFFTLYPLPRALSQFLNIKYVIEMCSIHAEFCENNAIFRQEEGHVRPSRFSVIRQNYVATGFHSAGPHFESSSLQPSISRNGRNEFYAPFQDVEDRF